MNFQSLFKKDYCSFSPDFNFPSCCEQHDKDYSLGSKVSRKEADGKLRSCITASGWPKVAWVYYLGVRTVGWMFYRGDGR